LGFGQLVPFMPWLKRGFDTPEILEEKPTVRADIITQLVINWLEKNRDKHFFLWLHYFNPHSPYNSPLPYKKLFLNDEFYGKHNIDLPIKSGNFLESSIGDIPNFVAERGITNVDYYISQYDTEIKFTDAQIGSLLETLNKLNLIMFQSLWVYAIKNLVILIC